ncbi:hypothetical protein [Oceanobacillus kimchii]|nr:hypothetical protein [Oceanobacillus kimchii]
MTALNTNTPAAHARPQTDDIREVATPVMPIHVRKAFQSTPAG